MDDIEHSRVTFIYHAVSCYADDGSESEPAAEPPAVTAAATTADTREKRKKGVADKREKKERCSCNKADHTYHDTSQNCVLCNPSFDLFAILHT